MVYFPFKEDKTGKWRVNEGTAEAAAIDLDPIVTGPWMDIWNITHRNRHVDRYVASLPAAGRAAVDGARTDL